MYGAKLLSLYIFFLGCIYSHELENGMMRTCPNETGCEDMESSTEDLNDTLEDNFNTDATMLPQPAEITSSNNITSKDINANVHKIQSDICLCDLTTSTCDINCCCDNDCNEFHLSVFTDCKEYQAKIYDSRYCYKENFIARNNTRFIHEKIAENLFCIAYDNLPPKYSSNIIIHDVETLKNEIDNIEFSNIKWQGEADKLNPAINFSNPYKNADLMWKFEGKFIKPVEFSQTGFTGHCTLKKSIRYLEDWKETCFQSDLTNSNSQLFLKNFNEFTILASPKFFNHVYNLRENQTCPKNICVPVTSQYCADSWNVCTTQKMQPGSCVNRICTNILKSVLYIYRHNGTAGIIQVAAYFKLANVSAAFYQHLEVTYEWADFDKEIAFKRSGNPGYILGKPVIIGTLRTNVTGKVRNKYVVSKRNNRFLTLPYADRNGECSKLSRFEIAFREDAKTRCSITLETDNFTSDTCRRIQNRTLEILFNDLVLNLTEKNPSRTYVSKSGDVFDTKVATWLQIYLDEMPINSVKGYIFQDEIWCEGLITSMKVDILHSLLSKPDITDNHMILGVGITFSNSNVVSWTKCNEPNCVDTIKVNIVNFVSFHDASKPSKYHFAVGPNIDIRLPYDFFYPFVSVSTCNEPSVILISVVIYSLTYHLL